MASHRGQTGGAIDADLMFVGNQIEEVDCLLEQGPDGYGLKVFHTVASP
jgi:hypothetical protein